MEILPRSSFLLCLFLLHLSSRFHLASGRGTLRVINGEPVDIQRAPFMAALIKSLNVSHFCGGTIIAPRVIATAAHCLIEPNDVNYVRVGSERDDRGGELMEVHTSVAHSMYSSFMGIDATYDYGVVILKESVTFSSKVGTALLARRQLPDESILTLFGYGFTNELMHTRIPKYDQKVCVDNYSYIPIVINPHVAFCAGFRNGNSSACNGDSGGPLIYGIRTLYGIVSWGDGDCTVPDYPSVFSRVDTMAEWFQAFIDMYKVADAKH